MIAPIGHTSGQRHPLIGSIPDYTQSLSAMPHHTAQTDSVRAMVHHTATMDVGSPDVTIRSLGDALPYGDGLNGSDNGSVQGYDASGINWGDITSTQEDTPRDYVSWSPAADNSLATQAQQSGGVVTPAQVAKSAENNLGKGVWDTFLGFGKGVIQGLQNTAASATYQAAGFKVTGQSVIEKGTGKLGTMMTGPDNRTYVLLADSVTPVIYNSANYQAPPASNTGLLAGMGVAPGSGNSTNTMLIVVGLLAAALLLR